MVISGNIVDVHARRIYKGRVTLHDGHIQSIEADESVTESQYILPGFIDAHVHIESSLLVPSEFVRLAIQHGTVATVSDPHEIANVCGMIGIRYMLENAATVPFVFAFGAPSCVPATSFETAGAEITAADVNELLADERILYLSEMMNWPGVLNDDDVVLEKLAIAKKHGKPIDGHAPGLKGEQARVYASHGISTDHECFSLEEAQHKLSLGMKILIREGSAARNYEALHLIIGTHPERVMFCCDDAHPDLLINHHINNHVRRSISLGYDVFDVLRIASVNAVEHYRLPVGLLREGDSADFIVVDKLTEFNVQQTWLRGSCVYNDSKVLFERPSVPTINNFHASPITTEQLRVDHSDVVRTIVAHDGELVTTEEHCSVVDPDVQKIVVVNRYNEAPISVGYVKGFGLREGALASSIAHDSHNIVAVGTSDELITKAINLVTESSGALAACSPNESHVLPLPVAGLMSNEPAEQVAEKYVSIDGFAKGLGTPLRAPFMTLSFMALLVIPQLKLSDKALFDGSAFKFVPLSVS